MISFKKLHLKKLKIWQRYFASLFAVTTLTILGAIFVLYIVIDAMAHVKGITREFGSFSNAFLYYFSTLSKRLNALLPFALLISTIRCLYRFQQRGEFVALLSSGTSKRKILQPFLTITLIFTALLFCNAQFFLPRACRFIDRFEQKGVKITTAFQPREAMLHDGSKIVYSDYDPKEETLYDLFWIRSIDELYHLKSLSLSTTPPVGKWVDEIRRNNEGALEKVSSQKSMEMKEMDFSEQALKDSLIPAEEQSITLLLKQSLLYIRSSSMKATELTSFLLYRLTSPLLTLLVFLTIAPFCLNFRRYSLMMLYLFSIAGLFCLHIILQTCFILAKSQVISPFFAIFLPWVALFYYCIKRYRSVQ